MLRQLELWDSQADVSGDGWSVRQSPRARRLSVRVFRHGGVEIVVPPRTPPRRVSAFVSQHREWIERQQRRAARPVPWPLPPPELSLRAVAETWACEIRAGAGRLRLSEQRGQVLLLRGELGDGARLRRALRDWLGQP